MGLWIESHTSLGRHRKLLRFAKLLRVNKATAVGHLHYLWWWAFEFQPDGNLSALTPSELAAAAEWRGDHSRLASALHESGFMDETGQLHDWGEYGGRLIRLKAKDKERKQRERAEAVSGGQAVDVPPTPEGNPSVPYPTLQYPTLPRTDSAPKARFVPPTLDEVKAYAVEMDLPPVEAEKFWSYYGANGWRVGKNPMKDWHKAIAGWKLRCESSRPVGNHKPFGKSLLDQEVDAITREAARL